MLLSNIFQVQVLNNKRLCFQMICLPGKPPRALPPSQKWVMAAASSAAQFVVGGWIEWTEFSTRVHVWRCQEYTSKNSELTLSLFLENYWDTSVLTSLGLNSVKYHIFWPKILLFSKASNNWNTALYLRRLGAPVCETVKGASYHGDAYHYRWRRRW